MENQRNNKPHVIEYPVFADDRGIFAPLIDQPSFKRVYYVYNESKGTVRGFHFHKKEWKYFAVPVGSAKFVAIDPHKPEEKFQFVSSARKHNLIVIPPEYANGWVSLADHTLLVCVSSLTTKESLKDDKRFDPYQWGDVWTVKGR